jgi:hypothetical protein
MDGHSGRVGRVFIILKIKSFIAVDDLSNRIGAAAASFG